MFELKIVKSLAAAHKLSMVTEKCENLHGHNWKIELVVSGQKLNSAGVLIDFGILKQYLSEIIDKLDHTYLNELAEFKNINPSSENLACFIAEKMSAKIKKEEIFVSRVTVWESDNACASYIPKSCLVLEEA